MDYRKLTVFNYKVSYYAVRLFTFYWLLEQIYYFNIYRIREPEFYSPTARIQLLLFPNFPGPFTFGIFCVLLFIFLVWGLIKQNYWISIATFFLVFTVNLPIAGYIGMGHHSHVLVLFYFFSLFLLPKNLEVKDYRHVQYLYLGILSTYSLAGIWKLLSMVKDLYLHSPDLSWYERNAALVNSAYNFYIVDQQLPAWMQHLYQFETLWVIATVLGIVLQAFSFLGSFNRRYLTFTLLFLLTFHFYTKIFVMADWKSMIYGLLFIFYPYHWFFSYFKKVRFVGERTLKYLR